jgi:hypothetical protein
VGHGNDGVFRPTPGGQSPVASCEVSGLGMGRHPSRLTERASQPEVALSSLPAFLFASTLVVPKASDVDRLDKGAGEKCPVPGLW